MDAANDRKGADMLDDRLNGSWWALRLTFGIVPIVAGLDKFLNLLTDWQQYLSPVAERILPISAATFMGIVGVIEIAAGVLVLARPRVGAYVVSAWLVAIALNLLTMGRFLDIAARDVALAVGAFVLGKLSEARAAAHAQASEGRPAGSRVAHAPA
jgi:hypothetical protein